VGADLTRRLVPDELCELTAPLLPRFKSRPQGRGTAPADEQAVFTAVVYVLTSGCAWRYLPVPFGVSPATAHRRFSAWTEAGLWRRLHRAVLDELGARGELDRTSAIVDAASVRAKRGARRPGRIRSIDRRSQAQRADFATKFPRRVLTAATGMKYAAFGEVDAPGRHVGCIRYERGLDVVGHRPADHGFGVAVDDGREIEESGPGVNVGDVTDQFAQP
jgi:transposase